MFWLWLLTTALALKVIVDQDGAPNPANGDTNSLIPLLRSPSVEVLGVISSTGDGWAEEGGARFGRLFEIMNKSVPLIKGSNMPQSVSPGPLREWRNKFAPERRWLGAFDTDRVPVLSRRDLSLIEFPEGLPSPWVLSEDISGAQFIVDTVHKHPGEITLVMLGALTTLAAAVELDPKLPSLVREVVFMGASTVDSEFIAGKRDSLDFNILFDVVAARNLFMPGMDVYSRFPLFTVVPQETCDPAVMSPWLHSVIQSSDDPAARYIAKFQTQKDRDFPMWDELTAILVVLEAEDDMQFLPKFSSRALDVLGIDTEEEKFASTRMLPLNSTLLRHPEEWYQPLRVLTSLSYTYLESKFAEYVTRDTRTE